MRTTKLSAAQVKAARKELTDATAHYECKRTLDALAYKCGVQQVLWLLGLAKSAIASDYRHKNVSQK